MNRLFAALPLVALVACKSSPPPPRMHHLGSAAVKDSVRSPEWVVDQFYGWTTFPAEAEYVTRDFASRFADSPTPGAQLKADANVVSRQLVRDDTAAVFATTVRSEPGVQELYTYLTADKAGWKIAAVRSLSFDVNFHKLIDSLKKGVKVPNAPPRLQSRLELAVAGDSAVKQYFLAHAQSIGAIADAFRAQNAIPLVDVSDSLSRIERAGKVPNAAHEHLRSLLDGIDISTVFKASKFPGCTFMRIAGVGSQQVGYFFAPKGCTAPVMGADRFIFIQRIGGEWYEYRAM